MTIRVARICKVDGIEYKISCEGGSAKEAMAYVEAAAEELGAAPVATGGDEGKPKRTRRTKEQIAADEAAAKNALAPPGLPSANVGRVFGPPPGLRLPEAASPHADEFPAFADGPPANLDRAVGLDVAPSPEDGPPPVDAAPSAELSPVGQVRAVLDAEHARIVALKPEWKTSVDQALSVAFARHAPAGQGASSADQLRLVLADLQAYGVRVAEALRR